MQYTTFAMVLRELTEFRYFVILKLSIDKIVGQLLILDYIKFSIKRKLLKTLPNYHRNVWINLKKPLQKLAELLY